MTLTARQEAVLGAVVRLREAAGYGPSLREIAAETRLSVSRVRQHLAALEARGRIARDLATARSIRLLPWPSPPFPPLVDRTPVFSPVSADASNPQSLVPNPLPCTKV